MLEKEKELALIAQAQTGSDAAKTELFLAYEKYIIKVARKYVNERIPLNDLIQHATIGFLEAINKYDSSLSSQASMSTFAKSRMLSHIFECINTLQADYRLFTSKPLKKIFSNISRYRGDRQYLSTEQRHKMARELDVSESHIMDFEKRQLAKSVNINYSYDNDENTFAEIIGDDELAPEKIVIQSDYLSVTSEALSHALSSLDDRERLIIESRFLPSDGKKVTLKELGEKLNVKHQRIEQLQKRGLAAMRQELECLRQ